MNKLLIAATLTAAAAATEGCPMAGAVGNREARHARMQAMHAGMGTHEGRGPRRGEHQGHGRWHHNGCPARSISGTARNPPPP